MASGPADNSNLSQISIDPTELMIRIPVMGVLGILAIVFAVTGMIVVKKNPFLADGDQLGECGRECLAGFGWRFRVSIRDASLLMDHVSGPVASCLHRSRVLEFSVIGHMQTCTMMLFFLRLQFIAPDGHPLKIGKG
ncbi:unnamed protein product, partial [Mesorhabditis belari]|uniref:Uncharacterized protein n=1 Tax=Mesorhabditis belari TaxID=2138241 RepID=A0AAF3J6S3_9BILA